MSLDRDLERAALALLADEPTSLRQHLRNLRQAQIMVDQIQGPRTKLRAQKNLSYFITFFAPVPTHDEMAMLSPYWAGTMLVPKADPLGRLPLVDGRWQETNYGPYMSVVWAGENSLWLGGGYWDQETDLYEYEGKTYWRGHTFAGVKIKEAGFAVPLYSYLAMGAYTMRGLDGIWSPRKRGAHNPIGSRTREATKWWTRQVKRGFAMETTVAERPSDYTGSEVGTTAIDYLPVDHVLRSGLYVFGPVKSGRDLLQEKFPFGLSNDPRWTNLSTASTSSIYDAKLFQSTSEDYDSWMEDTAWIAGSSGSGLGIYSNDTYQPFAHSEVTLSLLARAWHPNRPLLAAIIADALARQDESKAVEYVTRPDIAKMLAGNEKMKRLLARGGTPGLSGLSNYAHREMLHSIAAAEMSPELQLGPDENPMHFTPLPKKVQSFIDQLAEE